MVSWALMHLGSKELSFVSSSQACLLSSGSRHQFSWAVEVANLAGGSSWAAECDIPVASLIFQNIIWKQALCRVTECDIAVSGFTVSAIGPLQGITEVRRIVLSCISFIQRLFQHALEDSRPKSILR